MLLHQLGNKRIRLGRWQIKSGSRTGNVTQLRWHGSAATGNEEKECQESDTHNT